MSTPTVTETSVPLAPVEQDDFIGSPGNPRQFELPAHQRDLVALALLRLPEATAGRRR